MSRPAMPRSQGWLVLLALVATVSCDDAPPKEACAATEPESPIAEARDSTFAACFELTRSPTGATLYWGQSAPDRIAAVSLDDRGSIEGEPWTVSETEGPCVELAAAQTETGTVALSWVSGTDSALGTFGLRVDEKVRTPTRAVKLSQPTRASGESRGDVAVAAATGRVIALHRDGVLPCGGDASEPCVGFSFHDLSQHEPRQGGLPLVVPEPCARGATTLGVLGKTWFYAICADTGGTQNTTVFSIQYEPEYARSDAALAGCSPIGSARVGASLVFVADCASGRRVARFRGDDQTPTEHALDDTRLSCEKDRLYLSASAWGADPIPLNTPRDDLGPLLPDSVAPANSRAVYTGTALLVASPLGARVELRRYECVRGTVLRTDHL